MCYAAERSRGLSRREYSAWAAGCMTRGGMLDARRPPSCRGRGIDVVDRTFAGRFLCTLEHRQTGLAVACGYAARVYSLMYRQTA
jgi:hypothetical protein